MMFAGNDQEKDYINKSVITSLCALIYQLTGNKEEGKAYFILERGMVRSIITY